MSGSKPGERRGGRQKGTPNKVPSDLKRMILGALDGVGGEKYLMQQAIENPGPFMALIGKVLPTTLASDPDNPLKTTVSVEVRVAAVRAMLDAAYGEDGKNTNQCYIAPVYDDPGAPQALPQASEPKQITSNVIDLQADVRGGLPIRGSRE